MQSFTDTTGHKWAVDVTVATVKRAKALLAVDLLSVAEQDSDLYRRLALDPVFMCDVLYAACKPEADALGVTDEQFGERLRGEALDAATDALLRAIADFFPKGRREMLRAAAAKIDQALTLSGQRGAAEMERLDVTSLLDDARSASATSSPARSASTPAR